MPNQEGTMGDPKDDWQVTRDPKRNAQIEREVQEDLRKEAEWKRKEEAAKRAHRAKLDAMKPVLMERRTKCAGHLSIFETDVHIRMTKWENVAIQWSGIYESAYKDFSKAFSDAEKQSAQMWTLAFIALSMCSMGGIAVFTKLAGDKVANAVKADIRVSDLKGATFEQMRWEVDRVKDLAVSGVTDSVQAGVGGLMSMAPGVLAQTYSTEGIPSPDGFAGKLKTILNNVKIDLLTWCRDRKKDINDLDLDRFENYDPATLEKKINDFIAEREKKFNPEALKTADVNVIKKELEKAMWAAWCATQLEVGRGAVARMFVGGFRNLPDAIIDKLLQHGFIDKGRPGMFGSTGDDEVLKIVKGNARTVQAIMSKAVNRAKSFKPRQFG
jgi:hypothetical protein